MALSKIQLGKQGITKNFISTLKTHFKNNNVVKVSVLKSARESKEDTKKYSELLLNELGNKFTSKIIGHTIVLKKWRKVQR